MAVTVLVFGGLLAGGGCSKPYSGPPDFAYQTFDGKSGQLSGLAGKPYVLNFWAAW
jgi:hypothetical protein